MKKIIGLVLVLALLVGVLAGCGEQSAETPVEEASDTRVVVDALGREVRVPAVVDAIVPLGNAPRMITFLGLSDLVVGVGSTDYETITPLTAYAYANKEKWSTLPIVGSDGMGNTTYYP